MQSPGLFLTTLAALGIAASPGVFAAQGQAAAPAPAAAAAPAMTLTVTGFPDGGVIPIKFTQAAPGAAPGEGTSPAINWTNTPSGTRSFVLNMHDLDVARNATTDDQAHWVIWNLPSSTSGLPEGVPRGSQRRPTGERELSRRLPASGRPSPATGASRCPTSPRP